MEIFNLVEIFKFRFFAEQKRDELISFPFFHTILGVGSKFVLK